MPTDNEYLRLIYNSVVPPAGAPAGAGPKLGASENHLGEVGGNLGRSLVTLTHSGGSTTYTAGYAFSNGTAGAATPLQFAEFARINGGTGYINKAICFASPANMAGQLRLHLFSNPPTGLPPDDNTAFPYLLSNKSLFIGWIDFTTFSTGAGSGNASIGFGTFSNGYPMDFFTEPGDKAIYGAVQSLNAWTCPNGAQFTFALFGDRY